MVRDELREGPQVGCCPISIHDGLLRVFFLVSHLSDSFKSPTSSRAYAIDLSLPGLSAREYCVPTPNGCIQSAGGVSSRLPSTA